MATQLMAPPDTPPYVVRAIAPADLEIVRQIDRDAFEMLRRHERPLVGSMRLRTLENMQTAINRPHAGVVVEWPAGQIVGYCFTHVWGALGWLGTLGVTPPKQGFGLGKVVTAAGLDLLRQAGCRLLALETMPESGRHLGMYTQLGLDAGCLTLLLQGTSPRARSTRFEVWEDSNELRHIAAQIVPGLDPTPAARWLMDEEAGTTLVWRENGAPVAFAALRSAPRRLDGIQGFLTVEAAACLPEAAASWPRYVSEMQTYAHVCGKNGLVVPVNTRQRALLRQLLGLGLRIVHTRVRMVTDEELGAPDAILMMTLAM